MSCNCGGNKGSGGCKCKSTTSIPKYASQINWDGGAFQCLPALDIPECATLDQVILAMLQQICDNGNLVSEYSFNNENGEIFFGAGAGNGVVLSTYTALNSGTFVVNGVSGTFMGAGSAGELRIEVNGVVVANVFVSNTSADDFDESIAITWVGDVQQGQVINILGYTAGVAPASNNQVHSIHKI